MLHASARADSTIALSSAWGPTLHEWLGDVAESEGRTRSDPFMSRNAPHGNKPWAPDDGYRITFELEATTKEAAEMLILRKLANVAEADVCITYDKGEFGVVAQCAFRVPTNWDEDGTRYLAASGSSARRGWQFVFPR